MSLELSDNKEIESQHETPMITGNYLAEVKMKENTAEVNTTNKLSDIKEQL